MSASTKHCLPSRQQSKRIIPNKPAAPSTRRQFPVNRCLEVMPLPFRGIPLMHHIQAFRLQPIFSDIPDTTAENQSNPHTTAFRLCSFGSCAHLLLFLSSPYFYSIWIKRRDSYCLILFCRFHNCLSIDPLSSIPYAKTSAVWRYSHLSANSKPADVLNQLRWCSGIRTAAFHFGISCFQISFKNLSKRSGKIKRRCLSRFRHP